MDGWLVLLLSLLLYLATASRTVTTEDDGIFILAALFNGVAHPPGYPLYTLLGHLFSQLPFGSVAFRVHALSGVLGAMAVWALWWTLRALPGLSRTAAVTAALAFAASKTFWSQAIVAEVYSLNAAIYLAVLGLSLRYLAEPEQDRSVRPALIGLLVGLGLANHWPLLVLGCSGLAVPYLARWRRSLRDLPRALLPLLLGLSPYLWMLWRSQADPLISFYGPLLGLEDLQYVVSRRGYAEVDQSESALWADKLGFAAFFLRELVDQFSVAGAILGLIGFVAQWRHWGRLIAAALSLSFLASGVTLAFLLGFDDSRFWHAVFRVYPILAYAIWALWLALGFAICSRALAGRLSRIRWRRHVLHAAGAALILLILSSHAPLNDRRLYGFADRYATTVLETLPPQAILFAHGDISFGPIAYKHLAEGMRPDLDLYNPYGLILNNRLINAMQDTEQSRLERLRQFIATGTRPVCVVGDGVTGHAREESWLFWCVRRGVPEDHNTYRLLPAHLAFVDLLLAEHLAGDTWSEELRNVLLRDLGFILTHVMHGPGQAPASPAVRRAYEQVLSTPHGQVGALSMIVAEFDAPEPAVRELRGTLRAKLSEHTGSFAIKADNAALEYLLGRLALRDGEQATAVRHFVQAIRAWRSGSNPALPELEALRDTSAAATNIPRDIRDWLDSRTSE